MLSFLPMDPLIASIWSNKIWPTVIAAGIVTGLLTNCEGLLGPKGGQGVHDPNTQIKVQGGQSSLSWKVEQLLEPMWLAAWFGSPIPLEEEATVVEKAAA